VTQFFDERGSELRDLFFETAQELLQSLNEDALKLERTPQDAEIIRSIRRTVHTLKGDAAAAGFPELSELAHMLEDALAVETPPTGISLAELGFTAADTFSATLAAYQRNVALPDPAPLKAFVERLGAGNEIPGKKSGNATAPAVWTEYERVAAAAARSEGKKIIHLVARVDPLCTMPVAARQLIVNAAGSLAQILGSRPEAGSATHQQRIDLLLGTSQPESAILAKCQIPTVIADLECFEWSIPEDSNPPQQPGSTLNSAPTTAVRSQPSATEATRQPQRRAPNADTILRVDAERIDNVLNLVGELIIGKSMLQQAMQEYARRFPKDALRSRFADAMGFQARVLNDLQRSVMKIRMVPVEQLFRRFPRTARDAALRCGKQVELVISGQETDLDKSLLDAIAEPLTHIVRNAVSHGIESPEERVKAGKPAAGRIRLDAYHQANQLIVEVSDDGGGMDVEKIRAKALGTGLISATQSRSMAGAEVLDLVFRPGFSTAEEVTEISGRGVGLDVVRSVLQRLKGSVELETQPGKGTKFRLKLPLTLAIIKALMFRIEQRLYAIPLNTVAEIARAKECDLHNVDTWEVVQLRGQVLPLMRLGEKPAARHGNDKIFVLVISLGERKLGLIVDSLEGEEELVIKAIDDQTVATDLVSGASILGDGRVVLIMNLAAAVERFTNSAARGSFSGSFVPPHPRNASAGSSSEVQ
jgi:two-component system, chemotaxis family, sensor kinase CheA